MKRALRSALAALTLGVLAIAPVARADTPPSHWDRARDPDVGASYRLHTEVQRRLSSEERFERFRPFAPQEDSMMLRVREMLERAVDEKRRSGGAIDVRLLFDLGHVYLELGDSHGRENYGKSAVTLKVALERAPQHPAAEVGWLELAFACGHIAEHVCERKAYLEVLRIETEDARRATPSLNLAETEMHLGSLSEAVDLYRETLRLAGRFPSSTTAPLAVWGLAVALDRSGDALGAEKEARFALEIERGMGLPGPLLHSRGVFFAPVYEVNWYEGLGWGAEAKKAANANEALRLWRLAEGAFAAYVRFADQNDRWLALAKVRLANAKAAREAAEKAAARQPKPKTPPPDDGEERDRTL